MAAAMKSIASYVEERGITEGELATTAGLDLKLVKAIVSGNFTPSPVHRQRLAAALGVSVEDVSWGHAVPVEHLRGNGPQCGRPT
jgi:ribosome-binding protein aMBF1 (putative translation factor)